MSTRIPSAGSVRLAYADPPYPGKAHLYPEKAEVDHVVLIKTLCEYDGWALSTDERSLAYVLSLCPPDVRILAWCRRNAPPLAPNPIAAWEPVVLSPARKAPVAVRSWTATEAPVGFRQRDSLTGQKPADFCEWVIRCLGAEPFDTLDDLFPGTGAMGETWNRWRSQLSLDVLPEKYPTGAAWANRLRRTNQALPGLEPETKSVAERSWKRNAA